MKKEEIIKILIENGIIPDTKCSTEDLEAALIYFDIKDKKENEKMEYIKNNEVQLGNIVFMIHKDHPTKSGWWRKITDKPNGKYYILEKPVHKDYNIDDPKLSQTHQKDNYFVIKANTIDFEQNNGDKDKYQILANISGTEAVNLVVHNYDINNLDMLSPNVIYVDKFERFLEYINTDNKNDVIQLVAENYKK